MPTPPTPEQARRLRTFLREAGYTEAGLAKALGGARPPTPDPTNMYRLQSNLRRDPRLSCIVRCCYFGEPIAMAEAQRHLPADVLEILRRCGLWGEAEARLIPQWLLFPFEDLWFAADFYPDQGLGSAADSVMGVNPTALHLLNITLRRQFGDCLDLGTGCGIQALYAARHSDRVTATDINPKSLAFTAFNAALNGLDNVDCVEGDCFEPVRGRRFDLIVSNPPFFMTPASKVLFVDNDMELDGFCRKLVREGPAHLNQGGWFQMTCEWAEIEGELWRKRLQEWAAGCGCDLWVLKANTQRPESYAETRMREAPTPGSVDEYESFLGYYRERRVVAIHGGFIVMRRRDGNNWIKFDELQSAVNAPIGESLLCGFAAEDFLHAHDDEAMAGARLRLAPQARLQQHYAAQDRHWDGREMRLELHDPLPQVIGLENDLAVFLAGFDGSTSVTEQIKVLAVQTAIPPASLTPRLLPMVRALVEKRILLPVPG